MFLAAMLPSTPRLPPTTPRHRCHPFSAHCTLHIVSICLATRVRGCSRAHACVQGPNGYINGGTACTLKSAFTGVVGGPFTACPATGTVCAYAPPGYAAGALCDGTYKEETLDLSGRGLNGTIPRQLSKLAQLKSLDMHDNLLSGTLPTQLAGLTKLLTLELNGNLLSGTLPTQFATLGADKCYLTTSQCHAEDLFDCPTNPGDTNVLDCPLPQASQRCTHDLSCASWPASCDEITPQPPRGPVVPKDVRRFPVYRVQKPTWVANISNSDVADVAGVSCVIENFVDPKLYGDHPVLARYILEAEFGPGPVGPGNRTYLNCPDDTIPRHCNPGGDLHYVGTASCSPGGQPCDCSYISPGTFGDYGHWYSLPAGGECLYGCEPDPETGSCVGYSCHWQVAAIDKIVSLECMQAHGCTPSHKDEGSCPPSQLERAFRACPDLCTPPASKCSVPKRKVPHNNLSRLVFDPEECISCLAGEQKAWHVDRADSGSWSCGKAKSARGTLSITGTDANATDVCRCAYGDMSPSPPPPPCPGESYKQCLIKCLQEPGTTEQKCHDSCTILCPYGVSTSNQI